MKEETKTLMTEVVKELERFPEALKQLKEIAQQKGVAEYFGFE